MGIRQQSWDRQKAIGVALRKVVGACYWQRAMARFSSADGNFRSTWGRRVLLAAFSVTAMSFGGCREDALKKPPKAETTDMAVGLTTTQAATVLARVGDKAITLADFAATLERMDQFDRLRFQTPERRKELLDQMITVELLADEARRRGLDRDPETEESLRQVLRDAVLQDLRKGSRVPGEIAEAEVRAYYEAHKADFQEPERRRIGHLSVRDKAKAEKLVEEAKKAVTAQQWGELVRNQSVDSPGKDYKGPVDTLGDLGIVGAPSDPRGANPRIDEELRKAVLQIEKLNEVLAHPVPASDGLWHIVRLIGKTEAHARSYAESERTIRIMIIQQGIADRETALEAELRGKYKVEIDDSALSQVRVPVAPPPSASAPVPSHDGHDHDDD